MRPLDPRAILIVVGVSGSGKTTIATALAQRLGWPLEEGDELYPPAFANVHSAHPLYARDQWSWLEKVAAWIDGRHQLGTGGVITCSALKRSYRDFLTRGRPQVRVVYLQGDRSLIEERLAARKEHSILRDILDRHFAILEEPDADEGTIVVDVSRPMPDIVAKILRELTPQVPDNRDAIEARDNTDRPAIRDVEPYAVQPHPGVARRTSLVLLRQPHHRFLRFDRGWEQHGHRSSRTASRTAISRRSVAIESGTWRSVRIGSAPGSVIFGKGRHFDDSAATRL